MDENDNLSNPYDHVGVIGAGAWGTALALTAAQAGRRVTLWARETDVVQSITGQRENVRYLSAVKLPERIMATGRLPEAAASDAVLVATPAQHLRATLVQLDRKVLSAVPLVLCAKGLERDTGKLLTEILVEFGVALPAILSGPSFARDVARNLPTAVTIAAQKPVAVRLQATLGHAAFRPYASDDVTGVALGGAAKNVYAIGCGVVMGLGLGESARAALLARSFAELCRLGRAIGAKDESLMGLSGLGDLVLTATSSASRNFAFGLACGAGHRLSALLAPGQPLAEGVETAPALVARAKRHSVELPIAEAVADILAERIAPSDAMPRLMVRPFKSE